MSLLSKSCKGWEKVDNMGFSILFHLITDGVGSNP